MQPREIWEKFRTKHREPTHDPDSVDILLDFIGAMIDDVKITPIDFQFYLDNLYSDEPLPDETDPRNLPPYTLQ